LFITVFGKGRRMPPALDAFKEKRAIHPVTAAAIIIAMVIGVAGIVYIWMTMEAKAGNAIWIQNVRFAETETRIYVQNVGEGTVTLDSVYINGEKFSITLANCTVSYQQTTVVSKGQTAEVTVNRAFHGETRIKVVCRDGTSNEGEYKP